jgi:prepilin-type N-terminal cleavage/methylation domain-containing protein
MKLNRRGFTLVEVMVTVLIVAIVFGMVSSIVGFFSRFYNAENTQLNNQSNVRVLLLNLEQDIRRSNQEIDFSGSCYIIGTDASAQQTTYCYDSAQNRVTRNGVVVANFIDRFILTSNLTGSLIVVDVATIPDSRGQIFETEYTIYLRQAIVN